MGTKSKKSQKSKKNVKKPSAEKSAKNKSVKNKKVTTPSAEKPKVSTPEKKATTSPKPATTPDEPPATSSIGPISNPSAGSILGSSKPPGEKFAKNKKQPSTEKAPTPAGAPAAAAAVPTSLTALYNIETSGPGQALTAEELMKMKEEGKLAVDVDISMNPALYKVKDQKGEEHIVVRYFDFICVARNILKDAPFRADHGALLKFPGNIQNLEKTAFETRTSTKWLSGTRGRLFVTEFF